MYETTRQGGWNIGPAGEVGRGRRGCPFLPSFLCLCHRSVWGWLSNLTPGARSSAGNIDRDRKPHIPNPVTAQYHRKFHPTERQKNRSQKTPNGVDISRGWGCSRAADRRCISASARSGQSDHHIPENLLLKVLRRKTEQ